MIYSFFIIVDTDDASCFHIEMTKMHYRLRFSALKYNHIRKFGANAPVNIHIKLNELNDNVVNEQEEQDVANENESYHELLKKNYTYYLLAKKDFSSAEEALKFKAELIKCRSEYNSNVVSLKERDPYTVSFWVVLVLKLQFIVVAYVVGL